MELITTTHLNKLREDSMKIITISDLHIPYHDDDAIEWAINVIRKEKPDKLVIAGDVLDCTGLSRFVPISGSLTLQEEIDAANSVLDTIEKRIPKKTNVVFILGNHEARLDKYIMTHARHLDGMISLSKELRLRKRGWKYIPYGGYIDIDRIRYIHGVTIRKWAGMSALLDVQVEHKSIVRGHSHRLACCYTSTRDSVFFAMETGCLCDLTQPYLMDRGGFADWTQGLGIVVDGVPRIMHYGGR